LTIIKFWVKIPVIHWTVLHPWESFTQQFKITKIRWKHLNWRLFLINGNCIQLVLSISSQLITIIQEVILIPHDDWDSSTKNAMWERRGSFHSVCNQIQLSRNHWVRSFLL
jgi:hypothetical protein